MFKKIFQGRPVNPRKNDPRYNAGRLTQGVAQTGLHIRAEKGENEERHHGHDQIDTPRRPPKNKKADPGNKEGEQQQNRETEHGQNHGSRRVLELVGLETTQGFRQGRLAEKIRDDAGNSQEDLSDDQQPECGFGGHVRSGAVLELTC